MFCFARRNQVQGAAFVSGLVSSGRRTIKVNSWSSLCCGRSQKMSDDNIPLNLFVTEVNSGVIASLVNILHAGTIDVQARLF